MHIDMWVSELVYLLLCLTVNNVQYIVLIHNRMHSIKIKENQDKISCISDKPHPRSGIYYHIFLFTWPIIVGSASDESIYWALTGRNYNEVLRCYYFSHYKSLHANLLSLFPIVFTITLTLRVILPKTLIVFLIYHDPVLQFNLRSGLVWP
jgi:hypothetical protein